MRPDLRRALPSRHSLATKLVTTLISLVIVVAGLLSVYATSVLEQAVTGEVRGRAKAIALAVASALPQHAAAGAALPGYLDEMRGEPGVAYVYVHDSAGRPLLGTVAPHYTTAQAGCWARELRAGQIQRRDDLIAELPGRRAAVLDTVAASAGGAMVHIGMDREAISGKVADMRTGMLGFASALCFLGLILTLWATNSTVLRPLRELTRAIGSFVEHGDLTSEVKVQGHDEMGQLGRGFQGALSRLRRLPWRLRDSAVSLGEIRAQLSAAVPLSARRIVAQVYTAETSLSGITTSLAGLGEHVAQLHQSTGEVSKLIDGVSDNNKGLTGSVQAMTDSVGRAASAMEEMSRSVQGVAESIQEVHQSTAWVSQFIREMDRALQKVQQNSTAATEISTRLTGDAETCLQAMQKTISGIDQIRSSAGLAAEVIRSLGSRITQIGEMVGLIEGIAHQTNFLALNATIIAAQAGDQGPGFAVIASEIKGLAERVGVSTREIAELMGHIERESHNAVRAVERGLEDVEQGAQMGRETEVALRKIVSSATQAGHNVTAIAAATVEQTQGSASMTATIHLIATKMLDVREYAGQQARQAERVIRSTQEMKQLTTAVQETSAEGARRWQEISSSFENIHSMLELLDRAQREQAHGSEQVQQAIRAIHSVSEQQSDMVVQCEQALALLSHQAETLREEMGHFRV